MAESIGKLASQITADSDGFVTGMDRAIRKLEEFGKSSSRIGKLAKTAFKLGGIGTAITFVANSISNASDNIKSSFEEAASGAITMDEAYAKAAKGMVTSIPILGRVAEAMFKFASAIDVVANAERNFEFGRQQRRLAEFQKFADDLIEKAQDLGEKFPDQMKKIERSIAELEAVTAHDKAVLEIGFDFDDAMADVEKIMKASRDSAAAAEALAREGRAVGGGFGAGLENQAALLKNESDALKDKAGAMEAAAKAERDLRLEQAATEQHERDVEPMVAVWEQIAEQIGRVDAELARLDGMSELDIMVQRLRNLGAAALPNFDALIAKVAQLDAALKDADRKDAIQRFAESVIQDTLTPLEQYEQQMARIDEAWRMRLLTMEQYNRATKAAREELERLSAVEAPGSPGAFERGSREAYSAEVRAMGRTITVRATPEEKSIDKNTKTAAGLLGSINELLKRTQTQTPVQIIAGDF